MFLKTFLCVPLRPLRFIPCDGVAGTLIRLLTEYIGDEARSALDMNNPDDNHALLHLTYLVDDPVSFLHYKLTEDDRPGQLRHFPYR